MGKYRDELITPNEFIDLKRRIKAECLRRNKNGSVASYGGSEYDYIETPTSESTVLSEHMDKISHPTHAINTEHKSRFNNGDTITELAIYDVKITNLESKNIVGGDSGCSASCTGLCQADCTGTCTNGCSGTCQGNCTGSCTGSCSGCSGCSGCGSSCSYGCTGGCSGTCSNWCAQTCGNNCSGGCVAGCATGCDDGCTSQCSNACQGCGSCSSWA